MCGIIAAFNKKGDVNEWVINQYEEQYGRGQCGFGLVLINKDGTHKILRACEPVKMMFDLHQNPSEAILFHHRTPTSTENYLDQTHPIKVSDGSLKYDYLVVHNGIISNEDTLKKTHEELGFTYSTEYEIMNGEGKFNDSEALAIEVTRFIEEQNDTVAIRGSAAFVALQISKNKKDKDKVTRIFFGRNEGSPLNLSATDKKIRISSEGEGKEIKPFVLYSFAPNSYKFKKRKMTFVALIDKEESSALTNYAGRAIGFDEYENYCGENYCRNKVVSEDEGTVVSDKKLPGLEEIAKHCREKVCQALESYIEDLGEEQYAAYTTEPGDALREIADALYDAQKETESLIISQDEGSASAASTILND